MTYTRLCRLLVVFLIGGLSLVAHAQEAERSFGDAHLDMQVEVLPAALRVTVTSSELDFAQQQAGVGDVLLDPVTGEISTKVAGAHRLGEVRLTGPAGSAYGIMVTPTPSLKRSPPPAQTSDRSDQVLLSYRLRWASADGCSPTGFREILGVRSAEGSLGDGGCTVLRFGGLIGLFDVPGGRYRGSLHVSIFAL
ncbi:MAG: hypothetical protein ACE5G0_09290 [Rhodothermales bacterium]